MPFGLVNAPSTFQRAMSVALRGCEDFSVVYIDDILVFSEDDNQHQEHLRRVFDALQSSSYHVRLQKCCFFASGGAVPGAHPLGRRDKSRYLHVLTLRGSLPDSLP